jgi:hypothetical protein
MNATEMKAAIVHIDREILHATLENSMMGDASARAAAIKADVAVDSKRNRTGRPGDPGAWGIQVYVAKPGKESDATVGAIKDYLKGFLGHEPTSADLEVVEKHKRLRLER